MSAAGRNGFTLIEMLVVLAVIGLIAGIGFPSIERMLGRQEFLMTATRVELALRSARARALSGERPVRFAISRDGRRFGMVGTAETVPEKLSLAVSAGAIDFFADGSSTGGTVELAGKPGRRRFFVSPYTGALAPTT